MDNGYYFYTAPNGVILLKNSCFDSFPELAYGFTTRIGGVSNGECESLNLSWQRRDSEDNVKENHRLTASALGIDYKDFVFIRLVHGNRVFIAKKQNRNNGEWWNKLEYGYDAVITNQSNVAIIARTADCGNLLMYDSQKHVVSATHSGWKGTVADVIPNTINAMKANYGCEPNDIVAVFGPSICPECFLVHNDCADVILNKFGKRKYEKLMPDGRYSIDLSLIMKDQLISCGLNTSNIHIPDICTCDNSDMFFSHRRSKGKNGTMYAVIEIKE